MLGLMEWVGSDGWLEGERKRGVGVGLMEGGDVSDAGVSGKTREMKALPTLSLISLGDLAPSTNINIDEDAATRY